MFGPAGVDGLRVLDLYAGIGSFGLEALRRGAARVELVERNPRLCDGLRRAIEDAGASGRAHVHCGDVQRVLARLTGSFDVVFADPPYELDPFEAVTAALLDGKLLAEGGTVFLEHFKKTVLPESLPGLELTTRREYGDAAVSVYRQGPALSQAREPEKSW
jgi:16S rRNA (guanine(966)-N(2))-methyltransferase RsmD